LIHSAAGMSMGGGATFGGDVRIQNAGDVALYILSDTDNDDENDHPLIRLSQDNDYHALDIGIGGFEQDTPYFDTDNDRAIDFGTDGVKRMQIEGTSGLVHFYGGISADAGATFGGDVNILGGLEVGGYWAGVQEETIGVSVNNGSSVLTTGVKGHRTLPYACDIVDWRVTSTDSGAIEWGINYCTYANFPTMTAMVVAHHSEAPGIAATGSKDKSAGDIDGQWDKYQFDAGDIIEFEIDSVTTLTNCILELTIRRTS